jgi:hypothetical protein
MRLVDVGWVCAAAIEAPNASMAAAPARYFVV